MGEVVIKRSDKNKNKKTNKRKKIHGNKWGYGIVLKTSLTLTLVSLAINTYIITAKGQQPIEANFAFRECVRATRRAKTLSTYARTRGPMISAKVEGYDGLATAGVTHMEDAFGGLISGPLGLWKQGEIHVYEYQKGPDINIKLTNLKMSAKHWNNGNSDPCVDRQIYIGGQKAPQERNDTDFIYVTIGFLNVNCAKKEQTGYVFNFKSMTHGGSIMGRVYKAYSKFSIEDFPVTATSSNVQPEVTLTELGSILEDRDFSSSAHHQIVLLIFFIPLLLWGYMFVRLSGVKVTLNMSIASGSGGNGYSKSSTTSTMETGSGRSADTNTSEESGNELKKDRREQTKTKHINPRIIGLWKYPVLHLLYIVLFLFLAQFKRDDNGIIKKFITAFDTFRIDFSLHALALLSQELSAWVLSLYSSLAKKDASWVDYQRTLIYTYQYRDGYLRALKVLNIIVALLLLEDAIKLLPHEIAIYAIDTCIGLIFLTEITMVITTQYQHPFQASSACSIGALSDGFSIMTRQITTYLANQQVKGLTIFDNNADSIPGMEFVGSLGDALALARPDYVLEGFINGEVIQVSIMESSIKDNSNFIKFAPVGNHQFELKRHWLHQGKQGVALV